MGIKNFFSDLKVNSILLILAALISNSKIALSLNNGDESTSKHEKTVQKHLKLNPLKENLRNIKGLLDEHNYVMIKLSNIKSKHRIYESKNPFL